MVSWVWSKEWYDKVVIPSDFDEQVEKMLEKRFGTVTEIPNEIDEKEVPQDILKKYTEEPYLNEPDSHHS